MSNIVYCITHKATGIKRLVTAINRAQALRHVAQDAFDCDTVSAAEALALVASGIKPETAGVAADAPPDPPNAADLYPPAPPPNALAVDETRGA